VAVAVSVQQRVMQPKVFPHPLEDRAQIEVRVGNVDRDDAAGFISRR
jgi:hypothetical protein